MYQLNRSTRYRGSPQSLRRCSDRCPWLLGSLLGNIGPSRRSVTRVGPLSGRAPGSRVGTTPHRLMGRVVRADTTGAVRANCAGTGVYSSMSITCMRAYWAHSHVRWTRRDRPHAPPMSRCSPDNASYGSSHSTHVNALHETEHRKVDDQTRSAIADKGQR